MQIGKHTINGNVALSPMAGTSDLSFRSIASEMGSAFGITELVSARGIRFDPSLTRCYRYLEIDPEAEGPVGIQLFGFDPIDFEAAIPVLLSHPVLGKATFIDINMGCPVPKVVKTGAGSALMNTPELASKIVRTAVRAADSFHIPVTVKFRKGWDDKNSKTPEFASALADAGAAGICIHCRTKEQMYGGQADWDVLPRVKEALKGSHIPVFGNGDVTDAASAIKMMKQTGVDGIYIGRAAQGNPWLFQEIKAAMEGRKPPFMPRAQERVDIMLLHACRMTRRIGEAAIKEMRSQFAYYMKGQKNAAFYKQKLMTAQSFAQAEAILGEWVASVASSDEDV